MNIKFLIKTLGCKTNQFESAVISEKLIDYGYVETTDIKEADYYILNSCSVTHIADKKNLFYLRQAKRENPKIKTVLTGCMAQLEKEKLLEQNIADFVVGNYEKNDMVKILESGIKYSVSDIFSHNDFRYEKINQLQRTRASLKIQDGCNNRCSYCTIPFARGKNRSDTIEHIINQINMFEKAGYKEVVLTGIHIGQWGMDFNEKKTLLNLLEKIEETSIIRYRLGSLNPNELTEEFINFTSQSKKFCPHFHLSLQSCCNNTLKAMNRNYSIDKIQKIVENINTKFNLAYIGCDIIAGFAGETQQDFEITRKNLEMLDITKIHVFPYSRRKGTLAYTLPNQIKDEEKKLRCKILQEISENKLNAFLKSNIGTIQEVIIEKNPDKKTNLLKGVTKNYINVLIENSDTKLKDTLQKVIITEFSGQKEKMSAKTVKKSLFYTE